LTTSAPDCEYRNDLSAPVMNLKVMTTTGKRETLHEHGQGWLLVPQRGNMSTPEPVAEAAKAFGDNDCNVPKLLASSATEIFWVIGAL